jgi:transposase
VGHPGTTHSTRQGGRTPAHDQYAGSAERHLLHFKNRLPVGNLPGDFPPYSTVFDYYTQWRKNKVWQHMKDALREQVRQAEGREATPSAAILDSQSVKTTEKGGRAALMAAS